MSKSYVDLVRECDRFPYAEDDQSLYNQERSKYHNFKISGYDAVIGCIPNDVVSRFPWTKDWSTDNDTRTVTLLAPPGTSPEARSALIEQTLLVAREANTFKALRGWRNELYPIYGPNKELLANMERSATSLFGLMTYGVHMTAYVKDADQGLRIWVPRRARTKQTWPGLLDNTVAGGISTGEQPFECLVREAMEEALLAEEIVRRARTCGCVTYIFVNHAHAEGGTGLLQPECEYVYDLELDASETPKPCDTEVEDFRLWSVEEVKEALARGEFKPNCAVVLIDFFIRHGIVTPENERDYLEILARIHRRMEFPTI